MNKYLAVLSLPTVMFILGLSLWFSPEVRRGIVAAGCPKKGIYIIMLFPIIIPIVMYFAFLVLIGFLRGII